MLQATLASERIAAEYGSVLSVLVSDISESWFFVLQSLNCNFFSINAL